MASWCLNHFERYHLFRRIVLLLELGMVVYVTLLSFEYATIALQHAVSATYVVGVIAGIQAPIVALMGYSFKIYSQQRSKDVKTAD